MCLASCRPGGVYSASIPTTGLAAGQMLRWRVIAKDNTNIQATAPEYLSATDSDQYHGTVALDGTTTQLPIYHTFNDLQPRATLLQIPKSPGFLFISKSMKATSCR